MRYFTLSIHLPLVLFLSTTGCAKKEAPVAATKPIEVIASLAALRDVVDFEDFTGRLQAMNRVEIRALAGGYLRKTHFKEGGDVKEGDLLFEIDPRILKADLEREEAKLAQATARLKRLEGDVERNQILRQRKAISDEDFEKTDGDRKEAIASVNSADANRRHAAELLAYTKIYAPFSGQASRAMMDPGNLVEANKTILTTIVSSDPIYANFDVDERTMLRIRRLQREGRIKSSKEAEIPLFLGLADEGDFAHSGFINFEDNQIDPTTGTQRFRGVFPNPKRILVHGMFARVRLPIGEPHPAVMVPERAIGLDQGQRFVYVVNGESEVVSRKVKVGTLIKGYRVIEEGVKEGEKVIVSGLQRVRSRVKVDVKMEAIPAAAGVSQLTTTMRTQLSSSAPVFREAKGAP